MDFSSGMINDISLNRKTSSGQGYPLLLLGKESLAHVITFLDFESLLKLMSLNKTFREDMTTKPTPE
jgi:hypothetical protein